MHNTIHQTTRARRNHMIKAKRFLKRLAATPDLCYHLDDNPLEIIHGEKRAIIIRDAVNATMEALGATEAWETYFTAFEEKYPVPA